MMKSFCAGVIALAALGLLPNVTVSQAAELGDTAVAPSHVAASVDIGRIRSVLQLTPEQMPHWPAVESALRGLARQQQAETAGFVRRVSSRVVSVVLDGVAVERLARAARPLIAVLSDDQKRAAGGLAQEMGLSRVVMAALK